MSQPQITSVVSKATVAKLVSSERQIEKLDQTSETKVCNKKANEKSNPSKRPRTCISDSSGHSVCIEKDLEEINKSMGKIVKKDVIYNGKWKFKKKSWKR